MKYRSLRFGSLLLSFSLIFPALASAQQAVGIVTALKGKAQLTRATTQTALRFKDDLILRDLIDTQEKSLTRVLFGGKSTVTVRELSRLEVREELLPGGATRTVHELSSGSILVNVARSLMRRGDEVQIRTPNAVAAVRGSTIFAQYNAALAQSIFILLTGSAIVTPQGLPPITLTSLASVNLTGTVAAGVQTTQGTVTQAEANKIAEESEVGTGGRTEESAEGGVQEAAQLSDAV
ncbi:MAG: FecR domain-containing protein, partial [Deltaproteobacteria bacterium]|nr:FecR domain-containing protein [Deltaproteobacteria bacterium]